MLMVTGSILGVVMVRAVSSSRVIFRGLGGVVVTQDDGRADEPGEEDNLQHLGKPGHTENVD